LVVSTTRHSIGPLETANPTISSDADWPGSRLVTNARPATIRAARYRMIGFPSTFGPEP